MTASCTVPRVGVTTCRAEAGGSRPPPSRRRPPITRTLLICSLLRVRQWNLDDMFGHEPDLQLIAPNDATDDQVIRPVVAARRCQARHRSRFLKDDFMSV